MLVSVPQIITVGPELKMLASPQSEKERNGTNPTLNPAAIREQLNRLLAHSLFTNSKRYPVLLAYTVEQTLLGKGSELKERTIGIEAFGREPDYDVNVDPVVRMTAAEVRKRLSQYYYNPEHAGELVIELPVGSYIPLFREPVTQQSGFASEHVVPESDEISAQDSDSTPGPPAGAEQKRSGLTVRLWISLAIALLFVACSGFVIGRLSFSRRSSNLERFWAPMNSASSRITYCLGVPVDAFDHDRLAPPGLPMYGGLDVSDVTTLARSIVPLVPRHDQFRVLAASRTEFTQLREGPFVLIGAFDNPWTMRITKGLPFGFDYDGTTRRVVDRKSGRFWTLQWQVPNTKLAKDYAIVARIHDDVTGQPVIILGGILGQGTEAASEVVSNPAYLNALLEKAPKNWNRLNLEAILETNVIDGHAGPPKIIAVETW